MVAELEHMNHAGSGGNSGGGLADVIDSILDKGLVIDAFVRVSLVGIEVLTVDARVVVASVDTYLSFAEAVNRLDLSDTEHKGLPDLMEDVTEGGAKSKTKGALEGAGETIKGLVGGDDEDADKGSKKRQKEEG
jgi:gas vesicle structural protein